MKSTLPISTTLTLPVDIVTDRAGFLGQSGSGKTYAAMRLAELMLDAGAQIAALDPVGVWWGLRASADGKRPGYAIHVFGGSHGDLPLVPTSGALIADVLVDKGIGAVLDVSDFTLGEMHRFVSAFMERLFERKKRAPSPVHLFLEEAHNFAPQYLPPNDRSGDGSAALMLHRVERVVRVGRNYGIGSSLISQMPQAVAKKVLNQVSVLFAMRMLGAHERKAVDEWMGDKARSKDDLALVDRLPMLETGECIVMSPSFLKVNKQVKVSSKTTFDSSAGIKFGVEAVAPKKLAAVDVEALREAMKGVVEEAEKDDPKALRRRIAELEKVTPLPPAPTVKPVDLTRLERVIEKLEKTVKVLAQRQQAVVTEAGLLRAALGKAKSGDAREEKLYSAVVTPHAVVSPLVLKSGFGPSPQTTNLVKLPGKSKGMLRVLASSLRPTLTRQQIGLLAGLKHTSGTFSNYLSVLRTADFIRESGGAISITEAGIVRIGGRPEPKSEDERRAEWRAKLPGKCKDMFDALLKSGGQTRELLAERVGISPSSGTYSNYLSVLRSNGLIVEEEEEGGLISASPMLFERVSTYS